jgi:hypothetical protein
MAITAPIIHLSGFRSAFIGASSIAARIASDSQKIEGLGYVDDHSPRQSDRAGLTRANSLACANTAPKLQLKS